MQVGTEILLARMKEYPDEFFNGGYESRWTIILHDAKQYLPKEDVEALDEGFRQMQVDRFNERVLARLAGEGEQQQLEEALTIKASGRYVTGWADPRSTIGPTQYEADRQFRAMKGTSSLVIGANGNSVDDWLTRGYK